MRPLVTCISFYSTCDCGPTRWKTLRSGRHASNANIERLQAVMNVKLPENLDHLLNQKGPPHESLSHVLEVHSMSWPNSHSHHV